MPDTVPYLDANGKKQFGSNDVDNKLPIGEDTSPRALLANACIITNDIEKQKIREYKSKAENKNRV